ncbi:hypothetical protein NMQ14_13095 [Methyloversatilis sp. XJ19-13]|uniref:hypothetical protein n=1 Tax=Methyloversatilis sp. XJ19-13 TaxID=2963430 RepID=UPI00211C6A6B|nr:hypothetical protein [Methyloversatilis sp. XJ19-13]MCQ9375189.1 hypothetical protein [Methyloversatilis sp. XJ19-13]
MTGRILPLGVMPLNPVAVGLATEQQGQYGLLRSALGEPVIHNQQTGRVWTIDWPQLVELARAAGIDEHDPAVAAEAASAIARAMGKAAR